MVLKNRAEKKKDLILIWYFFVNLYWLVSCLKCSGIKTVRSSDTVSPGRCRWRICGRRCAGRAGWPRVWRTTPGRRGRSAASPGSPCWLLGRRRAQNCLLMEACSWGQSSLPPGSGEVRRQRRITSRETQSGGFSRDFFLDSISTHVYVHLSWLFLTFYPKKKNVAAVF